MSEPRTPIREGLPRFARQVDPEGLQAAELLEAQHEDEPATDQQHQPLEEVRDDHAGLAAAGDVHRRDGRHSGRWIWTLSLPAARSTSWT